MGHQEDTQLAHRFGARNTCLLEVAPVRGIWQPGRQQAVGLRCGPDSIEAAGQPGRDRERPREGSA